MNEDLTVAYDWFSLHWFSPDVMQSFDWQSPEYFYGLLLLPFLLLLKWFMNHLLRQKIVVSLKKEHMYSSAITMLRFVPDMILAIAAALLLVALARPQTTNEQVEQYSEGIDIMLVLDISESMRIEDFTPNRLEAMKEVAADFINGRFQDRIGMVVFAGEAFSLSPLTSDYELLSSYLREVSMDMIEQSGTAIGSALAVGVNRMQESTAKSRVIILLSDGDNNAGNIDPVTAGKLAKSYGIKVYTILMGKEGRVPMGKDMFGRTQYVENSVDEGTLRGIAELADGRFYRAINGNTLEQIFSEIDRLEKAEIKETRFKDTKDYYYIYLRWAVIFFLLFLLLRSTFMSSALED